MYSGDTQVGEEWRKLSVRAGGREEGIDGCKYGGWGRSGYRWSKCGAGGRSWGIDGVSVVAGGGVGV